MSARKVTFQGHHLWALEPDEIHGDYPLAKADHCDDSGELNIENALFDESYAHVGVDKIIRRYHRELGVEGYLVEGWV